MNSTQSVAEALAPPSSSTGASPSADGSGLSEGRLAAEVAADPVLCAHCGRTSTNGIVCQGICVADSGY
ncbi:MAG: hypothetical protein ACK41W_09200 [Cyanobacteriota bacterium]|jgi:hypothetical protein